MSDDDRLLLDAIEAAAAGAGAAGRANHPLYNFSRYLAQARPSPDPAFRQRLEAHLMTAFTQPEDGGQPRDRRQAAARPPARRLRWLLAGALTVAGLLILVVIVYPPAQAWAQGWLVRFGPFSITTGPTLPEQALTRTPEPPPTSTLQPTDQARSEPGVQGQNVMTLEEAQALVSFRILVPQVLPEGMQLASYYVLPAGPQSIADVTGTYAGGTAEDVLIVRQFPYTGDMSPAEFPIGDAPVTDVTVRGQPGMWVEHANLGMNTSDEGTAQLIQWSFLIWQEEQDGADYLLWMFTHNLPQAEMLKIAESLAP